MSTSFGHVSCACTRSSSKPESIATLGALDVTKFSQGFALGGCPTWSRPGSLPHLRPQPKKPTKMHLVKGTCDPFSIESDLSFFFGPQLMYQFPKSLLINKVVSGRIYVSSTTSCDVCAAHCPASTRVRIPPGRGPLLGRYKVLTLAVGFVELRSVPLATAKTLGRGHSTGGGSGDFTRLRAKFKNPKPLVLLFPFAPGSVPSNHTPPGPISWANSAA